MRPILAAVALILVAGCGADGPPTPPAASAAPNPGVSFSGSATLGVRL